MANDIGAFVAWVAELLVELPVVATWAKLPKSINAVSFLKTMYDEEAKALAAQSIKEIVLTDARHFVTDRVKGGRQRGGLHGEIANLFLGFVDFKRVPIEETDEAATGFYLVKGMAPESVQDFIDLKKASVGQFLKLPMMANYSDTTVQKILKYYEDPDPGEPFAYGTQFVRDLFRMPTKKFIARWMASDPAEKKGSFQDILEHFEIPTEKLFRR